MRTLALLFSLMLVSGASAQTSTPNPTPTQTPNPTPTSTVSVEVDTSKVVSVFQEDPARTLAEAWLVSGDSVVCSLNDKTVSSSTFNLTEEPYSMTPPTNALYCVSKGGASLGVSYFGDLNKSSSSLISNIGKNSVRVLPDNSSRSRALIQVVSGAAYCGYGCPATSSNGLFLTPPSIVEFKGIHAICCSSVSGLTTLTAVSEVGGPR